jgi:hypothetical protein
MIPRWRLLLVFSMGTAALALGLALIPTPSVHAQCGSQASSCKNCHEVQGQLPVNSEGEWHVSHAFGDFCEFCHAGNVQATDQDTAHADMVDPLLDLQASCGACHPQDLQDRAQVYAAVLGTTLTSGSASTGEGQMSDASSTENEGVSHQVDVAPLETSNMVVDDPNVVDYVERYKRVVLGIRPINYGNVILGFLIAFVSLGGGAFVFKNEHRLADKNEKGIQDFQDDVESMAEAILSLSPSARQVLNHMLSDPDKADDLLSRLSHIEPDLVHQIRDLENETLALLLILAKGSH